jgi:hypothetical protein
MNKLIFSLMALLFFAGCSDARREFVIYRDIPASPSITVIPLRPYDDHDLRTCNTVEAALIKMGISVLNKPAPHEEVITKDGASAATKTTESQTRVDGKGITIEQRFSRIVDVRSTFVILVDAKEETLKTIRVSEQEVVSILNYTNGDGNAFMRMVKSGDKENSEDALRSLVQSLGFLPK